MKPNHSEKRKHKRVRANLVYLGKTCGKGSISKDVSLGGLKLLNNFVPKTAKIMVEIYLEEKSLPITAKAQVVWVQKVPFCDKYYLGAKFIEMSTENLKRLKRFVDRKLKLLAA